MRITTLHAVIITFLMATSTAFAAPITIDLESSNSRHLLQIESEQQFVELCQLEEGASYWLRVVQQSGPSVMISTEDGLTDNYLYTAEQNCGKILLIQEGATRSLSEVVLSVSCMTCEPEPMSRFPNLTVQGGQSATELIKDIFIGGDCFEVQNASFVGNSAGIGSFSNGGTSIGIDNGVIISSGNINTAPGPNNQEGAGTNTGGGSHPDLEELASAQVFDATGITFQFTPTVPQIFFNYAFASEEYCEYVGAGFNDVFGFFISGPGMNGGFLLNGENIAVIPGTNTAVAIDEVNHVNNTAYFVGNSNSCNATFNMDDIQFDGFTKVLTAVANVQPCETYFIRLLVGDSGDGIFDSAVFLEANSFNAGGASGGEAISPTTGSNITYEACSDGYFVLTAAGDINTDRVIEFNIAPFGTATPGVDYAPFPTTVTVPAGQTEVIIPITVFPDQLIEGQETIVLELEDACSCSGTYLELIIEDVPPLEAEAFGGEICDGQSMDVSALPFGGLPGYSYTWNTGQTGEVITVSPDETTQYAVTVTDGCNGTATALTTVVVNPPSSVEMSGGGMFCGSDINAEIQLEMEGFGPWVFTYSVDGVFQEPILVEETPYTLEVSEPGYYFPEFVNTAGSVCEGTVQGFASIEISEFEIDVEEEDISCAGANDGSITASAMNGLTPYGYSWENLADSTSFGGNTSTVNNLSSGMYSVTVNDNDGCLDSMIVEIAEPDSLEALAEVTSVPNCTDANGGSINLTLNGGTPGYSYAWSNSDTIQNPVNLTAGTYTVTVTDGGGCEATSEVSIVEDTAPPIATAIVEDTITCNAPQVMIDGSGSSEGGSFDISWNGPGIVSGGESLSPQVDQAGAYILTLTNTDNGCISYDTVQVAANTTAPVAVAQDDVLNCYQPELEANTEGTSTGVYYEYQWSGPGIAGNETQLNPLIDSPGDYTLLVTDTRNGCTEEATITISENTDIPVVDAGESAELNCDETEIALSGSAVGNQADFVYQWSTSDGNIISGENTLNPQVDAAGSYQLLVIDTLNGCQDSAAVDILQDPSLPVALVSGEEPLNCQVSSVQLDATNSTLGTNGTYNWVTTDGNIASGENTLSPTVDAPGTYQLIILGGGNVCEDTATVIIPIDTINPVITPAPDAVLTCAITAVELAAQVTTASGQSEISWLGQSGMAYVSPDSLTVSAVTPGSYGLVVTDPQNGCTATVSTEVSEDTALPSVAIDAPAIITCSTTAIDLDATNSSSGADFAYQWKAPDGSVLSETSNLLSGINEPGIYTLQVENTDNGCLDSLQVEVEENINYPAVNIAPTDILDCINTSFSLEAEANSNGASLDYQWTTPDGNILSGGDTADPLIDTPGEYILAVTDESNDCVSMDTIIVDQDIEAPTVDAGAGTELNCTFSSYTLSGTATGNGEMEISWSTADGNIIGDAGTLNPEVNSAGTYVLEATNVSNGCSSTSQVVLTADTELPNTVITSPGLLDCLNDEVSLDGSGSDSGANYVYEWTTTDGSILGDISNATVTTNTPGTYTLQITNSDNDCVNTASVTVGEDTEAPTAAAGALDTLNCYDPSLQLSGAASSQGPDFVYEWTTPDGNLLSGENGLSPTVDAPGIYELVVTNTVNNCTATDVVSIVEDFETPQAAAAEADVLTCSLTETNLDATLSSQGGIYTYSWTTSDGSLLNGLDGLSPLIDAPGTYQLEVTNNINGCTNTTTVEVQEDVVIPQAEAGESPTLTCAETSLALDGTGSSQGDFSYEWTGPGIVSGQSLATPIVNVPGTYSILVTDLDNNCVAEDEVEVLQDIETPTVLIETPNVLNCELESQQLDASNSSQGGIFEYSWSTGNNGNIVQDGQTPSPTINQPGEYTLLITNIQNGCTEMASINVDQDIEIPDVAAEEPAIITCDVPQVTIDGSASSSSGPFEYEWTTSDGNIIQGNNTLTPTVSEGGTYELLITNTANHCTNQLIIAVEKDVEPPVAEAGQSQILNCTVESLSLDGANSSTGDFSYEWSGPGVLSGNTTLSPQINEPGIYTLLVTNNFNGCTSTDEVMIDQDIAQPVAQIADPLMLNCEIENQNLDGTATNQGAIFEYEWTATSNGNIIEGEDGLTPLIDAPGTYTLFVLNTENGCTDIQEITVEQDITIPEIGAEEPEIITCVVPEIQIDASASSTGSEFDYQWTTIDGNILSGVNSLSPLVDEAGAYELLITNNFNHCTNLLTVEVQKDIEPPIAEAGNTQELNCDVSSVTLDGNGSSTGDFSYQWEGPGLENAAAITTAVEQPGTYILYVTNNFNGCVSSDEVLITQDIEVPVVSIGQPGLLTCEVQTITLDASSSSQGPSLIYQWTTPNGNIIQGEDGLTPTINEPGQYTLTIIDTDNECENDLNVGVGQDIDEPTAEAGDDYLMDCWEPTDELNGEGSSSGPEFVYEWSEEGGSILSGANTLHPVIDAPGIYTLEVMDMSNGCLDKDDVLVSRTVPLASVDVVQPPCYGDPGHIYVPEVVSGTPPYVYSIDGGEEFFTGANFTNLAPGDYDVVVQDVNGCEHESAISIAQPDSMVVLLTVDETEISFGEEHQIVVQVNVAEEDISQIIWSNAETLSCDDCLTPVARPFYTTDYKVDVVSDDGCQDEAFLRIYVDRERSVYVPNVFSPNNDGANDVFYIFAQEGTVEKVRTFNIFNRWGEPVFEVYNFQPNDPTFGWDGFFRGELMNGAVFTWFAEIEFVDGTVELFEGDVLLFR